MEESIKPIDADPVEDDPIESEPLAGRYQLREKLGAGGMGEVYRGHDLRLDREVAIKVPRVAHLEIAPNAIERFEREALATAKLGHPNIVEIRDFVAEGERPFLVMENLQGTSLSEHLKKRSALELAEAVEIHVQLLAALDAAHDAGILHRDIKPQNVFLVPLDSGATLVKLLDFGLASLMEEKDSARLTITGMTVGTPAYMSPERLDGAASIGCDLFSVAVCMLKCLTNSLPVSCAGRTRNELREHADARGIYQPDSVWRLLEKALSKDPEARFRSAKEMSNALRGLISTEANGPTVEVEGRASAPSNSQPATKPMKAGANPRELEAGPKDEPSIARPPSSVPSRPGVSAQSSIQQEKTSRGKLWLVILVVVALGAAALWALR